MPVSCSALPTNRSPHHLVSLLDVQLRELVGTFLEASARHDRQVNRPPEVNQVLLRQVVDLVSGSVMPVAEA